MDVGYATTQDDKYDVGNRACVVAMAALVVESVLVARAMYAISLRLNREYTELDRIQEMATWE